MILLITAGNTCVSKTNFEFLIEIEKPYLKLIELYLQC
jgi:hypothetical protein